MIQLRINGLTISKKAIPRRVDIYYARHSSKEFSGGIRGISNRSRRHAHRRRFSFNNGSSFRCYARSTPIETLINRLAVHGESREAREAAKSPRDSRLDSPAMPEFRVVTLPRCLVDLKVALSCRDAVSGHRDKIRAFNARNAERKKEEAKNHLLS